MNASRAQTIRKIARATLVQLYQRRFEIWPEPPASPFDIIEPSAAVWLENNLYKEVEEISDFIEDTPGGLRYQQLAGMFDPVEKTVCVARNFGPEVLRFSAAHELGHLILHAEGQEVRLFRDPPIVDTEQLKKYRPEIEQEADLFAAEFLMPTSLLRKTFREYFGMESMVASTLDEEIAYWLSVSVLPKQQITAQQLRKLSSRGLALLLAQSSPWGSRAPFISLSSRFRVSNIAMAIQLENLGLVFDREGKKHQSFGLPTSRPSDLTGLKTKASEVKVGSQDGADGFDVFISYDNRDWSEVRKIVQELQHRGLRPWVDKWHLRPGLRWRTEITRVIEQVPAVAVFLGPNGGEQLFEDLELASFLKPLKGHERPLIPVILPNVKGFPELPACLDDYSYIDSRLPDPDPLDQLIVGITGSPPRRG